MAVVKKGEDFADKAAKVCLCGKPPGRGLLIQCGSCQQWYHFKCIRMTSKEADKIDTYKCDRHQAASLPVEPTDPARKTVVTGFENLLGDRSLALGIEDAMHRLVPDDYKTKYRSLLLNMKANGDLVESLKREDLSPEHFVTMSAEELANKRIRDAVESIKEAKQRDLSLIEESGASSFLFQAPTSSVSAPSATPAEPSYPAFSNVQPRGGISSDPESGSAENPVQAGSDFVMAIESEPVKFTNPFPLVWKGQIVCPGLGFFPAEAFFLTSPRALPLSSVRSLLPHHLHVQGKLERARGVAYLKTLLEDPTRHMNHLLVIPQRGNSSSESAFAELRKQCADKISVLIIDPARLKDFYLVDIADAETESAFAIPDDLRAIALIAIVVPVRK